MSFSRTVVSRRTGFNEDGDAQAIFGTSQLGGALGVIKSSSFSDMGDKKVLTNNTVVDTITYTGLGVEATYEVAWKMGAAKPEKGDLMRLPAPVSAGVAEFIVVVESFEVKYEEEGYRMATLKTTHHAGFIDPDAAFDSPTETMRVRYEVNGTPFANQTQPASLTGISDN